MAKPGRNDNSIDPLDVAIAPPPDETEEEREKRLSKEREAKVVSDAIDEEIEAERTAEKKKTRPVKILLLGQSESGALINGTEGKSTTLKNFQLMYEPKAFRLERASWRAVIQLNVVRSFHLILDAITRAQKALQSSSSSSIEDIPQIPTELLKLKLKLTALLTVEGTLIRRLTPDGSGETEATQLARSNGGTSGQNGGGGAGSPSGGGVGGKPPVVKELAVNSTKPWKDTFNRLVHGERDSFESGDAIDWEDPEDPGRILHDLSDDMIKLWNDPITQLLLEKQNLRMQELAGFFLDQLERVTAPRYVPTDDDILKARLKTLGVTEHRFTFSSTKTGQLSRDWKVFDVGGHRSQADSVGLWSEVSSNKLLKRTNLILFLNKIDIFRMKLEAGIRLADYIVSYTKENDFDNTTMSLVFLLDRNIDLRKKFANILQDKSPLPRAFYCHLTTVTDPKSTKYILANLKEMLMIGNLAKVDLV
ncbi:hypothetical protein EST38_g3878 [Candolleomyces aberdarensis]|uniref:Uncharacterized protein n=1 Tax=Candolleomyces aberdarensis TaxID=2316362 RepID=A0A4Q2DS01_9AGAR|nr:hypothetical protein EST38_g3878 [Candolleomyces aberdarensis]